MNPQTLAPGPELDKLVQDAFPDLPFLFCLARPSTNPRRAMDVLGILRKRGWHCQIDLYAHVGVAVRLWRPYDGDTCRGHVDPGMPSGPATALAICRAALEAREQEKQNGADAR